MIVLLLSTYSVLICGISLAGGWAPLMLRLTHTRMQLAVSFVSGVMLGVGFFHLLPHAMLEFPSHIRCMNWVVGGFLLTFFLQRFLLVHHHSAPHEEGNAAPGHCSAHDAQTHAAEDLLARQRFSWGGAALGLAVHSLMAGVALAAAVQAEWRLTGAHLAGFATFLAIFFHKPFDSLTITTLMTAAGWSKKTCHAVNAIFAVMIPLGVVLFYLGSYRLAVDERARILGPALALSAGVFLCISASDLLPEMQFHSHDRLKLSLCLLAGVALAYAVEVAAHQYEHDDDHTHGARRVSPQLMESEWLDGGGVLVRRPPRACEAVGVSRRAALPPPLPCPALLKLAVQPAFAADLLDLFDDLRDHVVVGADVAYLGEQRPGDQHAANQSRHVVWCNPGS